MSGDDPTADERKRELLREVAVEIRGDSRESEQLSAIVYRLSDLYDPAETTTPEEIYRSARHIMRVTERGTLERRRG
jgi:hypothetical protein